MNKRQIKKKRKNTHLNILKELQIPQLTLEYSNFGSEYFGMTLGDNCIMCFKYKELPIKFGVWMDDDKYEIFGEPIPMIDKFKPSATSFGNDNFSSAKFKEDYLKELVKPNWGKFNDIYQEYLEADEDAKDEAIELKLHDKTLMDFVSTYNKENIESKLELRYKDFKHSGYSWGYYITIIVNEESNNDYFQDTFEKVHLDLRNSLLLVLDKSIYASYSPIYFTQVSGRSSYRKLSLGQVYP